VPAFAEELHRRDNSLDLKFSTPWSSYPPTSTPSLISITFKFNTINNNKDKKNIDKEAHGKAPVLFTYMWSTKETAMTRMHDKNSHKNYKTKQKST
jgi:hypothetical protein